MNWLSENYKWVFDGIGAAILVGLIAWLWRRFFKEPAAENATISVQDSQVTGSPIASGSRIVQHNYFTPAPTLVPFAPPVSLPTQDRPRPNMHQTGARVIRVNEPSSNGLMEDQNGKAGAVVIQFTNEARLGLNAGASVKASLIYENDGVEVLRTMGVWMHGDPDGVEEFRVDESRRLVVGILIEKRFITIDMVRLSGGEVRPDPHFPTFQTVRVRLTDADNGNLLYEGRFRVTLDPLGIAPLD